MDENPCSNQEVHMLVEHGFELENTQNEPCIICMTLNTESVGDQTDHCPEVFVCENIAYSHDMVTKLWHSKVYTRRHFV